VLLRDRLVTALDAYGEGTAAEDDVTFVLCQFDPPVSRPQAQGRGAA
jgi:hypothetical protein